MKIDSYYFSDKGERPVNEDSVGLCEGKDFSAFILCDGLGGHGKGDIASKTVVDTMTGMTTNVVYNEDLIDDYFIGAQEEFLKITTENPLLSRMKTTGVLLLIHSNRADWGHIGDSRLYYFKKNKYVRRTLDHSVPQLLCNSGEIKEKDIRHHEDRNRLLRCFGESWDTKRYEVDAINQPLEVGDAFIMCSDGFWDWVDEKQMQKCLKKGKNAEESGKMLIELAFKYGKGNNMDNLSIIVVKLGE